MWTSAVGELIYTLIVAFFGLRFLADCLADLYDTLR